MAAKVYGAMTAIPAGARPSVKAYMTQRYKRSVGDWALPSVWTMKYRMLDRAPMTYTSRDNLLKHRPWMIEPVDDMSPTIVIKKARQMGFTEIMINDMIHMASLLRCRTIYTMPKWDKAKEIAKTRIDPVGRPDHPDAFKGEVLERLIGWGSIMFKEIYPKQGGGTSEILVTSSWNEDLGESTAADRVFLDEFDRMKPGVISAFRECLSASRLGHLRLFSTPTFPKVGVDGQYRLSDKRRWMYKCPRCNHWQALSRENIAQVSGPTSLIQRLEAHDDSAAFPDGTFKIICVKCQRPLNRHTAYAKWVEGTRNAEIRGYAVSQLDCVWHTADNIMRKLREYKPGLSKWMTYVLGEAYRGDAGQLSENFVYTLVQPELVIPDRASFDSMFKNTKVSVGIDWGKTNWAFAEGVSTDLAYPILLEAYMFADTNDPEDTVAAMANFCKKWGADVVVADYGYGQDRNPKLYKALSCQFWVCKYPPAGTAGATVEPLFGHTSPPSGGLPMLAVGRAPSLKERILDLHNKHYIIPSLDERVLDIIDMHFRNIAIILEELNDGSIVEVAETTGPDHYLHAHNYAAIGRRWIYTHMIKVHSLDAPNSVRGDANAEGLPTFDDIVDTLDLFGIGR